MANDDVDGKFADVDEPRIARAGELTDLALLPGEFRAFRSEMRSALELLINKMMPAIERLEASLVELRRDNLDLHQRVSAVEMQQQKYEQRLEALERKPRRKAKR